MLSAFFPNLQYCLQECSQNHHQRFRIRFEVTSDKLKLMQSLSEYRKLINVIFKTSEPKPPRSPEQIQFPEGSHQHPPLRIDSSFKSCSIRLH
ncbi:hypothetical protein TNCT_609811 [Trichonephila clavata]|uniref:Uncharacterized protein n=1 Tax=Trichonephila clavata TaxID=2740835 RepID=A0A8X6KTH8_TRICU|nr:hypothetical protein TNCT_609811 [Trichonephila clavata]